MKSKADETSRSHHRRVMSREENNNHISLRWIDLLLLTIKATNFCLVVVIIAGYLLMITLPLFGKNVGVRIGIYFIDQHDLFLLMIVLPFFSTSLYAIVKWAEEKYRTRSKVWNANPMSSDRSSVTDIERNLEKIWGHPLTRI